MDNLPPEIICDIFLKTLPHVLYGHHNLYFGSISASLLVSHVCRSWRELALSCCELWSYLYIHRMYFTDRMRQKMMVEIFDTWLARTNGGPINFKVDCAPPFGAAIQDHEWAEYIFTTLVENQHRWKDVRFRCHGVKFSPRFPGFNLTNMPRLTSLNLDLVHSLHLMVNLTASSRLRRLEILQNIFDLMAGTRLPHLECATLIFPERYYSLPEIGRIVDLCLILLKCAPSLVRFRVSIYSKPSPLPLLLNEKRITHTGLRQLDFWPDHTSVLPAMVIETMTLPCLEQLIYCSKIGGESLLRFFQRSMPPLASLEINENDVSEDSLISILRLLPTLRQLKLAGVKLSGRFFYGLAVPDDTSDDRSALRKQVVCPLLSFFDIFNWFSGADALGPLLTMAKSRASVLGKFRLAGINANRLFAIADIDDYADAINPGAGFILM